MHPRNRHQGRYDFPKLLKTCPELAPFAIKTPRGDSSIDFADPAAVLALNRALLKTDYGVPRWDIPPGYLCPPIPGRADYIHHVADLIGVGVGKSGRILDVGVGANCVYPIIGRAEYGSRRSPPKRRTWRRSNTPSRKRAWTFFDFSLTSRM